MDAHQTTRGLEPSRPSTLKNGGHKEWSCRLPPECLGRRGAPQGVANRDLKLENLLLDRDGSDGTRPLLKICDFGYSKVHSLGLAFAAVGGVTCHPGTTVCVLQASDRHGRAMHGVMT